MQLPPDVKARIEAEVAAGRAKSADDLIASVLRSHFRSVDELRENLDAAAAAHRAQGGVGVRELRAEYDARFRKDD